MEFDDGYDRDALINGQEVRARAPQAIERAIDAVLSSSGRRRFTYLIRSQELM